jgi:hypothetical protein
MTPSRRKSVDMLLAGKLDTERWSVCEIVVRIERSEIRDHLAESPPLPRVSLRSARAAS